MKTIEVFSAGCSACEETIDLVNRIAQPGTQISVHDMNDARVAARAKALGIGRVPAVVIDGSLAPCCQSASAGPDARVLREAFHAPGEAPSS